MAEIAPSVLSADFKFLEKQLKEIENAGVKRIHIDVMDGVFVPNISLGFPVIKSIRSSAAGADIITVHQETCRHLPRVLSQIKEAGCKAGVALNPATSVETLKYVVHNTDQVLLMTVNPGFGGQAFIADMIQKIKDCKKLLQDMDCNSLIELDGGITVENAAKCIRNGADILVAGSSVFCGDIQYNIRQFQTVLR